MVLISDMRAQQSIPLHWHQHSGTSPLISGFTQTHHPDISILLFLKTDFSMNTVEPSSDKVSSLIKMTSSKQNFALKEPLYKGKRLDSVLKAKKFS